MSDLSDIDSLVSTAWYQFSDEIGPRYDVVVAARPVDGEDTFGGMVSLSPGLEEGVVMTVVGEGYELSGDGYVNITTGEILGEIFSAVQTVMFRQNPYGGILVGHAGSAERWAVENYSLESARALE